MAVEIPDESQSGNSLGDSASPSGWTTVGESDLANAAKDPQPARSRKIQIKPQPSTARARVTAADKKDMKAKISLMLLPGAALWGRWDEYCGSAFAKVVPQLSEDLADIFADNAEIVAWFAGGTGWLKYLKLLNTLQPVGEMMWAHHIAKTVGEVKNGTPPTGVDWDQYTVPTPGAPPGQQARSVPSADSLNR